MYIATSHTIITSVKYCTCIIYSCDTKRGTYTQYKTKVLGWVWAGRPYVATTIWQGNMPTNKSTVQAQAAYLHTMYCTVTLHTCYATCCAHLFH